MVTIVFALAVANLVIGFALAVVLDYMSAWSMLSLKPVLDTDSAPLLQVEESAGDDRELTGQRDWAAKLKDAEIEAVSNIEQLLWIIKLETSSRRERLVDLDRSFFEPDSPRVVTEELVEEFHSFHQLLESWIPQADAERKTSGPIGEALEEVLLDQAFQLRSRADALADADCADATHQLAAAMKSVNILRDRVDEILCRLLTTENRLHTVANRYRMFGELETLTQLGQAAVFNEWWSDDPDHIRLISLVMVDIDRFESFTEQVGAARGDLALQRVGDMLHDLLRKDRGFDRVTRLGGPRFVISFGDTSAKNAAKGAERIRQTIEATSFKLGDAISEVTASLAVVEVGKSEGPGEFVPRLEVVLNECKKAGRNCGFMDSGSGPRRIQLPQYSVSVRMIELDELAAV